MDSKTTETKFEIDLDQENKVSEYPVVQRNYVINVPNIISFGRLLSVPLAVWLVLNHLYEMAFWLFVAACLSDAVDGYIAKNFNLQTELGAFIDPIADKALLVCVFITLGNEGLISSWLVILVVFRDALIVCGALLYHLLYQNLSVKPLLISKVNTGFQFTLSAIILGGAGFDMVNQFVFGIVEYAVSFTTIASGMAYVFSWGRKAIAMELSK